MDKFLQDLLYGFRMLRKRPGFTIVAVLTLAIGIGANTAIFSVINGVLLRQLPYKNPERLAMIWNDYGDQGQSLPAVSAPDFLDYRRQSQVFEEFSAANGGLRRGTASNLTSDGPPIRVEAASVTANFFPLLGVTPILGRQFKPEENLPGGPRLIMLSYGLWQSRFAGDQGVVGKTIQIGGEGYEVVGVLPENFTLLLPAERFVLNNADIWAPLQMPMENFPRNLTNLTVFGRLKPNATWAQAQSDMDGIAERLRKEHEVHQSSGLRIRAVPLHHDIVKSVRPALYTLLAAVGFVLLIACGNVANLLLARAATREREIAIRAALGASRWRIVQQILTESLLLSLLGGAFGLVLAYFSLEMLVILKPANLPRITDIGIDQTALAFTFGISILTTLIFGSAPAIHAAQPQLSELLKKNGRGSIGALPLRRILIVSEIALSLVLLIGAGLFIRSFAALQQIRPGFDAENVLSFQISLPLTRYGDPKTRIEFNNQLAEKLRTIPGVQSVGAISKGPLSGSGPQMPYAYNEETAQKWESLSADWRAVTDDYFHTMGIKVIAGRNFNVTDDNDHPPVIVIDELLAKRAWPGENPIGKKLLVQLFSNRQVQADKIWVEVVGLVEHVRAHDLTKDVREQIYVSYRELSSGAVTVMVKTDRDPNLFTDSVKQVVAGLDKDLPVYSMLPMSGYVANAMAQPRFTLILIGIFGATALLLSSIGLYGTVSFNVSQRTQEIGIRMALGAQQQDIFKMVVGQGLTLTAIGVGIGLVASLILTHLLANLLYGVKPTDPLTFITVTVLLLGVAVLATYLPARRATKVDPMIALRYE